jgi:hypothetical protein
LVNNKQTNKQGRDEFALGRKFPHQISNLKIINKQISKEGPATNGNVQSFHGYLRPTPIDGVLALKWQ